jgi:hypothetical protein
MTDRHDFIASFTTETYVIYCDEKEVNTITSGVWANLEDIFAAARVKVEKDLPEGRRVGTGYINTDKDTISFWTYKIDEWWTL